MSATIRVVPVEGRRALRQFLTFPWRIYHSDPVWVPPLLFEQKKLLNRRQHPFHQHADVQYFLAWSGDELVGRIAAIVNHQYVNFHHEPTGFFGFFESLDDPQVATALLKAAERWAAAHNMTHIRGPMSFSTNEECGLLIEGFDSPPAIMMPYNPAYYAPLIESARYDKVKDLLAYQLDGRIPPPERLVRGITRLQRGQDVTIRPINRKHLQRELEAIYAIYHSAWERNWGFTPMTKAEFDRFAEQLRWVANPHLCLMAEVRGEPVGFALALPDYNQALRYVNGRLLPFGIVKLLWSYRKIDSVRILILGLKPGFRRLGLDALLYVRLWQEAPKEGYFLAECSWILEDNWPMRRALERMGASITKTYRIYEKPL